MADKHLHHRQRISVNAVTSCISTTLMLILLGTVVFFVTFAAHFSNNLKENFTITLLLDDEITPKEARCLQADLRAMPCARLVTYISKERALKEQSEALQSDPSEFMGINPMPASFEVHLKADYAHRDSLARVLPALEKRPGVLDVSYPQNLLDSLNRNISRISSIMLIVALLLTIVSFVLINNTIRLSVFSRRFLINTMKLVGASWSFIRKPFLLQALGIALISATLAAGLLGSGIYALTQYEPQMQSLITWDMLACTFGLVFACGILLTLACAYFTVNSTLKMKTEHLYRY